MIAPFAPRLPFPARRRCVSVAAYFSNSNGSKIMPIQYQLPDDSAIF
jgi:hypothetical protein